MTSRSFTRAGIAVVLYFGMVMKPAPAEADSVASTCPAYPAHLRAARERLTRADRAGAVVELHRADEALASCLREEAAGNSLLARQQDQGRSS